jgi:hypothetical protein
MYLKRNEIHYHAEWSDITGCCIVDSCHGSNTSTYCCNCSRW